MEMVRREVGELTTLADHLYGMVDLARHEPELGEETFVRLDDLRWLLGSYVINGGRIRRLAQLPDLLASCDVRCRPEDTIDAVRVAAADLLQRINDTNTVTVDWLLRTGSRYRTPTTWTPMRCWAGTTDSTSSRRASPAIRCTC